MCFSMLTTGKKKTPGTYKAAQKDTLAWAKVLQKATAQSRFHAYNYSKRKVKSPHVFRSEQSCRAGVKWSAVYRQITNTKQKHPISKLETTLSYKQSIHLSRKQPPRLIVPKRERNQKVTLLETSHSRLKGVLPEEACPSQSSFP